MEDTKLKQISAVAQQIETSLALIALTQMGTLSPAEFMRAAIAGTAQMVAKSGDPKRPEEVADTFSNLFRHAILETMRLGQVTVDYSEFDIKGVLKRIMAGIELDGREAEFALGLKLIDTDGKPTEAARGFWNDHGRG